MHTQSGGLVAIFSFLNFYDLDEAAKVNQDWSRLSKQCEVERLGRLKKTIDALEPPQGIRSHLVSLVEDARNCEEVFQSLAKMEKVFGGVHLGVSCLDNWNYAVAMRSRFVILLDQNMYVTKINDIAIELVRTSKTRQDFQRKFIAKFSKMGVIDAETRAAGKMQLEAWGEKTYSAFHTEKRFQYIQHLAKNDRIVTMTCSLSDEAIIPEIAKAVRRVDLTFASLYLSTTFRTWSQPLSYIKNVERLKNDKTCIGDGEWSKEDTLHVNTKQRIFYGKDFG